MGAVIKPLHDAAAHDLLWWLLFMCHATVVCCSFNKLKMLSVIKIETPDREDSSSIHYAVFVFLLICLWTYLQATEIHYSTNQSLIC